MKKCLMPVIGLICSLGLLSGCGRAGASALPVSKKAETVTGVKEKKKPSKPRRDVDYDLTEMGSDMVYAYVFQMMNDPKTFEGKRIKIAGELQVVRDRKRYYYCVVKDALACCSNGVEFVCGKGDDKNAKAYPKEKTDITVIGTYETYKEKGSDSLYCRLKDATIETGVKQ